MLLTLLTLLFLASLLVVVHSTDQAFNDDVLGLIVFKAGLTDPHSKLTSWNEDDDNPCNWVGIQCDPRTNRVSELQLHGFSLSGHIGRSLLRLQFLRVLSLSNNNFSGTINPILSLCLSATMGENSSWKTKPHHQTSPPPQTTATTMSDLPRLIITDVLSRLPIRILSRCRCVCKLWRTITTEPIFTKMHLSRASSPSLILQTKTPKHGLPFDLYLAEPTTCHSNDAVTTISTKFNRSNLEFDLVGSINGLLCLSEPLYYDPVYICNPIIGEYMTLPKSEIETGFDIVSGFGFDQSTDRYKGIRMLYVTVKDDPTTTNGMVSFRMEGEIYTVGGSGEWRRIGEVPYPLRARESEAYLNGVLHWLMTDQDIGIETCEFIGAFDVASEEFRSLPPPQTQFSSESRTSLRRLNLNLGVLGDELCIFDNYFSDRMEIWMMKDYGVQSSWTKQYVIKRPRSLEVQQDTRVYFKPLKHTHNGEVLMLYDSVAIVCYNPVGKIFYHLGLFGLPVATNVCKAIVHVGSLVSLRNVAANDGENSNTAVDKSVKSRKNSDIPYGTWDTILYPIPTHEPKLDICRWLAEKGVALHIGRLDRPSVLR